METDRRHPIVLFDGVCNLCNASVNFIIPRDPHKKLRFSHLQSPTGRQLLANHALSTTQLDSLVLLAGGRCHTRSSAALRLVRYLRFPWPLLSLLLIIPVPIRNAVYDYIARHRYRWFGRTDSCRLPTPELQSRFLD